jgi:hypothetical protein
MRKILFDVSVIGVYLIVVGVLFMPVKRGLMQLRAIEVAQPSRLGFADESNGQCQHGQRAPRRCIG